MKKSKLLHKMAMLQERIEGMAPEMRRLKVLARNLESNDRCPFANIQGSDFCAQHRTQGMATISSLDPPKPGGRRCRARVELAPPREPPPRPDAGGSLTGSWRSG